MALVNKKSSKVRAVKGQKGRRGLTKYKENPFVSPALVGVKTKRITNSKGGMMVVHSETLEVVTPVAGFWQAQEVDSAKFVKLYVNGVKAFKELTGAGTKVFELLYLEVQKNVGKDIIWLSFAIIDQGATPMAKTTFMRGMRELLEKGFIAESPAQSRYFINPDYMWNGDRLAFVKSYYRKPSIAADLNAPIIDQFGGTVSEDRL
jgi:hypothetical protein